MRWKKPKTEEEWAEYLSAFIDGELTNDEITRLKTLLKKNPDRSAQLEVMKKTSGFLKKWEIEAPQPEAEFIKKVREQADTKHKYTFLSWFRLLRMQQVLPSFIVGLFAGIFFMAFVYQGNSPAVMNSEKSGHMRSEYTISQRQVDQLLSEIDAEKLKVNILGEIKKRNITTALKMLKELESKYPESQALKDLNENRKLIYLQKRIQMASLNS